jgi:hypothetical protein
VIDRSKRPVQRPCAPWVPITDPKALTVANLERVATQRQAFVYTRGANVELSRTTPVASLSARWHAGTPQRAPALPAPRPAPAKRPPAADPAQALLEAVKTDPKLRLALMRALQGGAA